MLANPQLSMAFLFHDISQHARYRFDARARALGVTRPQWRALMLLSRIDGPSQSELSQILEVERITLCRMIDRLTESGLVERRADPSDRRIWRLYLTDQAYPLVEKLSAIAASVEQEYLSVIDPQEQVMLTELLLRIRDRIRTDEPGWPAAKPKPSDE